MDDFQIAVNNSHKHSLMRISIIILLILSILPTQNFAQDAKAKKWVSKYLKALGNAEYQPETIDMEGEIKMPQLKMPLRIRMQQPNKMLMEASFMGQAFKRGTDGETEWEYKGSIAELSTKPASDKNPFNSTLRLQSDLLDYEEKGHNIYYEGKETIKNQKAHKIRLEVEEKGTQYYYISIKSKMIIRMDKRENGETERSYFGDYRQVDGTMFPHWMSFTDDEGQKMEMQFETIKFDTKLNPSIFEVPQE